MRAAGNKLAAAEAQAEMVAKALDKEATMASVMQRIKPSSAATAGVAAQQSPTSRPPSSSSSRPGSSRAQRLYSAAKRRPLSGSQPQQSHSRPASGTVRAQAERDAEQAYLDEVMREPAMGIQAAGGGRA